MRLKTFIIYFGIALFGVIIVLGFTSKKEKSLWGVPITPELLTEQGKLDVPAPQGKFNPEGEWEQTWKIWLPGRGNPNEGSGFLKVKKELTNNQSKIEYQVQQLISENSRWGHFTNANISASNNLSGSSVKWEKGAQFFSPFKTGNKSHSELNLYQEGFNTGNSNNEPDNFISNFTLFDAVQRMSVQGIDHLDFTLLDELDKVKTKHSIVFSEETTIRFAGATQKVRCYEETGRGLLPWKYYVDTQGRMLLAISGMRVYILYPGIENEYKGKLNSTTLAELSEQKITEKESIKKSLPNILFITTDQQAWNTISAFGNNYVHPPNIARLVQTGVSFKKSYSPNPVCSPTRACWITGLTSSENGVINNGLDIVKGLRTVGSALTEKGYETVFAGKLHVGIPKSYKQKIPGFAKVLCEGIGGKGTLGDQVVSSVVAGYLQNRDKSKPFFVSVNFLQPHDICNWISRNKKGHDDSPFSSIAKEELPPLPDNFQNILTEPEKMKVARNDNWNELDWKYYLWSYYRMIEEVDAEIGRVLTALDESGETDNTVIIFNSDHGEGAAHHKSVLKNFPYDEACRVPFIISYPKELKQGVLNEIDLVSGLDVVPTICDFAEAEPPANYRGISLRAIAAGKKGAKRDFIVSEMNNDQGRMIRSSEYKLIAFRDDPNILFFDMKNDPGETKNLASDKSQLLAGCNHRAQYHI
ncbi:MAG: sulfatase-like hydrolase/transferase [Draconibacterium sp.]|nr:sulfatase-like hydrolase/transferase [Draconibacterium sp.]